MNCKGGNFLSLQHLKGISFLLQAKGWVGVVLVVVAVCSLPMLFWVFFPTTSLKTLQQQISYQKIMGWVISDWGL